MYTVVENGLIWSEIPQNDQIHAVYKMGEKPPLK